MFLYLITKKMKNEEIELSSKQKEIFEDVKKWKNVLVLAKGGTWKSVIINKIRDCIPWCSIVAPSWIAAVNIGGSTIHSTFSISIYSKLQDILFMKEMELRRMKLLVIDEIGMVRADLFDLIDERLKEVFQNSLPFGGIQIVLFWDLYQIPPVVRKNDTNFFAKYSGIFFFNSKVYPELKINKKTLTKSFRQSDEVFVNILDKIREWKQTDSDLDKLNTRFYMNFWYNIFSKAIQISTTNAIADIKNMEEYNNLTTQEFIELWNKDKRYDLSPVEEVLHLKEGMRIMTVVNKEDYSNWTIWTLIGFNGTHLFIELDTWKVIEVGRHTFKKKIKSWSWEQEVEFTQFPVRMAWAVSIHKSQWQTFEQVSIDFWSWCFVSWQAYVALSRCKTLEGIFLYTKIRHRDIFVDKNIINFKNNE